MKWKVKKKLQSVVGLMLTDGQLQAVHMVRAKGAVRVLKSTTAALSLDLLHPERELIGREIKNHLDAAGIRERHCVVALPTSWIMSQHTKVPDLSPVDTASFLHLEGEKGFPCDPDQLQIARSFQRSTEAAYVTQLAVRKEQLEQLAAVLKAAGLKPVSFSLGLAAFPDVMTPAGTGRITAAIEPKGVTMLVSAGGGIAAFRTSEATIESEAGENVINGGAVARELRITFEQVPPDLRGEVKQLYLCGNETMVRQLAESLAEWAGGAGLTVKTGGSPHRTMAEQIVENLASHWLAAGASELEFLPPRPGRWALLMARYNSKRLASTGFALCGVALLTAGIFGWQQVHLWLLRSDWGGMAEPVKVLEVVQGRIREFRPWYDTTFRSLSILRRVTEGFPDNGSVTVKTFEIRGVANANISGAVNVNISGTVKDNAALLRTQDQLRKAKEIQGLKIEQVGGKKFTLTFRWNGAPGS